MDTVPMPPQAVAATQAVAPSPHAGIDPNAYLRLQLRVVGEQGKTLGKVEALDHDPATGQLTGILVRHGLLGRSYTQVPAGKVKWVNQDSVVLQFTRSKFKKLPPAEGR